MTECKLYKELNTYKQYFYKKKGLFLMKTQSYKKCNISFCNENDCTLDCKKDKNCFNMWSNELKRFKDDLEYENILLNKPDFRIKKCFVFKRNVISHKKLQLLINNRDALVFHINDNCNPVYNIKDVKDAKGDDYIIYFYTR